jgi:hypothetical protein
MRDNSHSSLRVATFLIAGLAAAWASRAAGTELVFESPRPLADALRDLESRYGIAISYEDPRYRFAGDIEDATTSVRRDLDKFPPGQAPRVLGPRIHRVAFDDVGDLVSAIQSLIREESRTSLVFELRTLDGGLAVVPSRIRAADGSSKAETPVLDAKVQLADGERNAVDLLEEICAAVTAVTGTPVKLGVFPRKMLAGIRIRRGASNEPAREVLRSVLAVTGESLSWRLFYDVTDADFALNIHVVPNRSVPQRKLQSPRSRHFPPAQDPFHSAPVPQ